MEIYIIILLYMILVSTIDIVKVRQINQLKYFMFFLTFIILSTFAGFRFQVGVDYFSYVDIYDNVDSTWRVLEGESNYADIHGESGYLFLNSIVKSTIDDASFVFIIMAIITSGIIFYSTYKYSPFIFISIFYYFCRYYFWRDMGQIRSGFAAALILYSIESITKREFSKFILIVAIASLFHKAALFVVPIYFISFKKWKTTIYMFFLGVSVLIGMFFPFKDILSNYIGVVANPIMSYTFSRYGEDLDIFSSAILLQVFILLLFLYYRSLLQEKLYYYDVILNMYAVSTYWLIALNSIGTIAGRVSTIVATVEMLIVPSLLLTVKRKSMRLVAYICIIILGISILITKFIVEERYMIFFPYRSIFEYIL